MTYSAPNEEWERLPWLLERPVRRRRRDGGGVFLGMIAIAAVDALGSYAAGRISVLQNWPMPQMSWFDVDDRSLTAQSEGSEEGRLMAAEISRAGTIGWQRRRPNAPY